MDNRYRVQFDLDENGRPIPPMIVPADGCEVGLADSPYDLAVALQWAAAWHGVTDFDFDGAVILLRELIGGMPPPRSSEVGQIVTDAYSCLSKSRELLAIARTSQSLPWVALQSEHFDCCDVARRLANKALRAEGGLKMLPLPGCTSTKCWCYYQQMTDRKYQRWLMDDPRKAR